MSHSDGLGTLGKLPLELRKRCYEIYFDSRYYFTLDKGPHPIARPLWQHGYDRDLLTVSKQVYDEAKSSEMSVGIKLELDDHNDVVPYALRSLTTHVYVDCCSWATTVSKDWAGFPTRDYPALRELSLNGGYVKACPLRVLNGSVDDLMKARLDNKIIRYVQAEWDLADGQMPIQDSSKVPTGLDIILFTSIEIEWPTMQNSKGRSIVSDCEPEIASIADLLMISRVSTSAFGTANGRSKESTPYSTGRQMLISISIKTGTSLTLDRQCSMIPVDMRSKRMLDLNEAQILSSIAEQLTCDW